MWQKSAVSRFRAQSWVNRGYIAEAGQPIARFSLLLLRVAAVLVRALAVAGFPLVDRDVALAGSLE